MRSYPCVVVGLPDEGCADYVARHVHEGDAIRFRRAPQNTQDANAVACFHNDRLIGYIPSRRTWVARSIEDGDIHQVTVTGFDIDHGGKLACVEIDVATLGDGRPDRPAVKSIISEIGDELRILAMVGAADGQFDAAEQGLLERFAEVRAAELAIEPDEGEAQHAVRWARRHVPDILDVAGIVNRLASERPEALEVIWEACALMAEIDGQIANEERQSMITLRSLLQHGMATAKRR